MDPGKRNRRIVVLTYSETKDEEGTYKKIWSELFKIWAHVKPFTGKEVYTAQTNEYKATMKINIRYNSHIKEGMRVLIEGSYYSIVYIEDVNNSHKEMWLTLEKVI